MVGGRYVCKASRLINFALGDCAMFAARLTAAGWHGLGLGLVGALGFGCASMVALALGVNRCVALTWALMGLLCVVAGTLWTLMAGGGVGVVLVGLKVLPMVIIGGLDSLPGTLLGALVVGLLESLATGYLDPLVGGGFSTIAAYLVALVVLWMRPYGLLGTPDIERV